MLAKAALIDAKMGEKGESSADFWLQSAIDEREAPQGIFPPLSLSLPPLQKALHLFKYGKEEKAKEFFRLAMADYANDVTVLEGYEKSLRNIGDTEKADAIRKHVKIVTEG